MDPRSNADAMSNINDHFILCSLPGLEAEYFENDGSAVVLQNSEQYLYNPQASDDDHDYQNEEKLNDPVDSVTYYPELSRSSRHTVGVFPERLRFDTTMASSVMRGDEAMTLPSSCKQAMTSECKQQWHQAVQEEIVSLHDEKVWKLVYLPEGRKAIAVH